MVISSFVIFFCIQVQLPCSIMVLGKADLSRGENHQVKYKNRFISFIRLDCFVSIFFFKLGI